MADQTRNQRSSNEQSRNGDADRSLTRWGGSQGLSRYERAWSPFEMMRRFSEDVDRLFGSMGFGSWGWPTETSRSLAQRSGSSTGTSSMTSWAPSVDIATRGDDLVVMAELPGIKPEDVQVEIEGNNLVIQGESRAEQENKDQGYWYSERRYGSFYRTIPLPQGVKTDNAQAEFKNGVLEVTLPGAVKAAMPQRRKIEIGSAQQQGQQMQQTQQPQQGEKNGNGRSREGSTAREQENATTK